jgi:hypothetical protein
MPATQLHHASGATGTTARRTEPRIAARIGTVLGGVPAGLAWSGLPEAELGARLLVA